MPKSDGSVTIDVRANGDSLKKDLKASEKTVDSSTASMEKAFEDMANASGRSVSELKADVAKLSREYQRQGYDIQSAYQKAFSDVEAESSGAKSSLSKDADRISDAFEDSAADAQKEYKKFFAEVENEAEKLNPKEMLAGVLGGMFAGGVQALWGAVNNLADATAEYQKIMGSLEISSQKAGYTAEQTKQTYTELYGVLGDDQTAATTTANLQAIGLEQEKLNEITNASIGAWATYGDSIPIDSLSEAINETIKTGTVTGSFADVLNWAGTSEDEFNKKLQSANNETEKANLVLKEMSRQGLVEAGEAWKEQNKALYDANVTNAKFQETMSRASELVLPIVTALKNVFIDFVSSINFESAKGQIQGVVEKIQQFGDFVISHKDGVIAAITGIATAFGMWKITGIVQNMIKQVSAAITALMGQTAATKGAETAQRGLNAAMNANPLGLVITIISTLISVIMTLWTTNEDFRNAVINIWNGIKDAIAAVVGAIVTFFTETLPNAIATVINFFKELPSNIWNAIVSAVTNIYKWGLQMQEKARNAVVTLIKTVVNFFKELPGKIWNAIVSAVTNIYKWGLQMQQKARSAVTTLISNVIGFFKQLPGKIWNAIVSAVTNIVKWGVQMQTKARNAVKNVAAAVVNGLKSIPGKVLSIGKNIVKGLWNGINDMVGWVLSKIKGFGKSILNGLKSFFGIHSPSKLMEQVIGHNLALGISVGFTDEIPDFTKNAEMSLQGSINALKGLDTSGLVASMQSRAFELSAKYNPVIEYENPTAGAEDGDIPVIIPKGGITVNAMFGTTRTVAQALAPDMDMEIGKIRLRKARGS